MEEAEVCNKVAIIDKGKIVAHDTPYNLKRKYTSSTMKVKVSNSEEFISYLKEQWLKYKLEDGRIIVYASEAEDVLEIASVFKETIQDIEIAKGTLNDVFIAITGKEIRE